MSREEQIFLGSCMATSREILIAKKNIDLETDEGIDLMFKLAEKIYQAGILRQFLDTVEKKIDDIMECPKCKERISKSWIRHFKCGWIQIGGKNENT